MRDQRRAGPGGGACPGQHGQVEGGEVREAQPFLAAGGQTLEVQLFQVAGDAVAAPAGHDGGGVGFDSPLEGLQACLVVAGKALLVGGQRLRIQRQPKALALQQPARPLHAAAVGNRPGRGDDVDVAGVRGKVQRTGRQVGGTGCGGRAWHGGGSSMNGHEAGYLNAAAPVRRHADGRISISALECSRVWSASGCPCWRCVALRPREVGLSMVGLSMKRQAASPMFRARASSAAARAGWAVPAAAHPACRHGAGAALRPARSRPWRRRTSGCSG